jgi:hypothetical protein
MNDPIDPAIPIEWEDGTPLILKDGSIRRVDGGIMRWPDRPSGYYVIYISTTMPCLGWGNHRPPIRNTNVAADNQLDEVFL